MPKKPGRPRTRPPAAAPKLTQQELRKLMKAWEGADPFVVELCLGMVARIYEIPKRVAEGNHAAAEHVRKQLDMAGKKLAARIKRGSH